VIEPPPADQAKLASATQRVNEELGRQLMDAYIAALKAGTEVKINEASLEKKQ
jgi:hypothetical protein